MIDTIPQVDNATINHEMGFVPRKLVPVQVGRLTVELYPKIKPKWPVHERAHAFQVNKAVLKPTPVVIRLILDALGAQLHCSTAVEGLIQEWKDTFETQWVDFNSLTNQTFHNTADNVINDTTTQEDPCVLLPVIDDERANCRKPDVRYVRVQCNVDFCPLVTIDPPGNTTLRVSYYIELPQTRRPSTTNSMMPTILPRSMDRPIYAYSTSLRYRLLSSRLASRRVQSRCSQPSSTFKRNRLTRPTFGSPLSVRS
mmetsp:Transcript_34095/g.71759  ORF Transcript_34095/g.71759 Transcript_34095/m.71759 type:complete len:255 (-) Transcript_34095:304-1068(-)